MICHDVDESRNWIISIFKNRSATLEARYLCCLQLVERLGERWSYVAGKIPESSEEMTIIHRFALGARWGVVAYFKEDPGEELVELEGALLELTR